MPPDSSWTEEEWRWFQLSRDSKEFSVAKVQALEEQLNQDPSNIDVRVQILSYYRAFAGNKLKHKNAEQKLFEQVHWLIENKPSASGYLAQEISRCVFSFKPKAFAALRQAWLEQVSAAPSDGTVLGNAATFIAWRDFETASDLFERAYAIQPESGWLGHYVIHCCSELWSAPDLYADRICERIIDVGLRSLNTESAGAPFLTCEYVSDAALRLGRFEIVRYCAEILRDWDRGVSTQMANAYLGLVALRESNQPLAVQLLLETKRGYVPQEVVFRLARELFDAGERDSIAQLVRSFKRRISTCAKNRWLAQIANDERPDFQDWCVCSACKSRRAAA